MSEHRNFPPHKYPVNRNRLLKQLNDIRAAVAIGDPLQEMPKGRVNDD